VVQPLISGSMWWSRELFCRRWNLSTRWPRTCVRGNLVWKQKYPQVLYNIKYWKADVHCSSLKLRYIWKARQTTILSLYNTGCKIYRIATTAIFIINPKMPNFHRIKNNCKRTSLMPGISMRGISSMVQQYESFFTKLPSRSWYAQNSSSSYSSHIKYKPARKVNL